MVGACTFMPLIAAVLVAAFTPASSQTMRGSTPIVTIGGRVICESDPRQAENITIELKDSAAVSFFDHLIDSTKTNSLGQFKLSGVAEEHWFVGGLTTPYLLVPSHHCVGQGNNADGQFSWKKELTPIKASEFKDGFNYGEQHEFVIDATKVKKDGEEEGPDDSGKI